MTETEVQELFTTAALEAAVSLFSAYHVSLRPVVCETHQQRADLAAWFAGSFVSVIGFSALNIDGRLVLATTREPLEESTPSPLVERDWIAELSNQFLGRIKNKMLKDGIGFDLKTPAVTSGQCLSSRTLSNIRPWTFATKRGTVCFWIELKVSGAIQSSVGLPDVPPEGEVVLF
jgi:CheY-specific phosphatase CheX